MSESAPLTMTLPADLSRALREAVAAGEYGSLDAALAAALTTWSRRHEERAESVAWVRARVRASLADPAPDLSEDELDQRLRAMFERSERGADEAA